MRHFLYFDDAGQDRDRYAARLNSAEVEVVAVVPPPDLALGILAERPWDLFLIDYELMGADGDDVRANYRGGTLAIAIKERAQEYPVVLFTRQGLEQWQADRRLMEAISVFDDIVFKGDLDHDPNVTRDRLSRVADGFEALRSVGRDWNEALGCLGAVGPDEDSQLRESGPPIEAGTWEVAELAKWIQHVLIRFPGVLYDSLHASAVLGLSVASFMSESVQALVAETRYTGAFAPGDGRWWRGRILDWAADVLAEAGVSGPIFERLGPTLENRLGRALESAVCTHCDEAPADNVCFVRGEHVKTEHSLAYFPDARPASMDTARVSYRAIRDSNDVNEELIDANGRDLVQAIQSGVTY